MLLNSTDERKYEGNLQGEVIPVGIHDMRLIIDRLTDMYADREMAVIREYSCNAQDAHIEAGITSPIEVTTPGPLEPFLTIRDFGVGLCLQDIREIYSQYGASTKRNTNSQTGAFGLGCKSGLAYSDQFTVTSIKDGVRIQVVVSRDREAGITMRVVDTADTSDPNGTTVMIPARSYNQFERKAHEFFKYWRPGTVRLNGAQPKFMPDAQWVTDDICINAGVRSDQSYAVMGGVPYPVTIRHGLGYYKSITAFVPIGSMDIPGNRESVIDTDKTKSAIAKVEQEFKAGLALAIQKDIANAGSYAEAATKKRQWVSSIGTANMPPVAYKGKDVPDSYKTEFEIIIAPTVSYSRRIGEHSVYPKDQHISLPHINGALWVTGFDYVNFTATVKKKLEKYVEDSGLDRPTCFVLTKTQQKPDMTWLENITFVDWPTIKAIKLPKAARSNVNGRIPGSYDIFESGDLNQDVPADDIDTTHDLFWMTGRWYDGRNIAHWLNKKYPGCTLVTMRAGREEKFQRLFPKAKDAWATVKAGYKAWVDTIDKNDALAIHMRENADSRIRDLDMTKLDDPEIKHARQVMDRDTSKLDLQIKEWRSLGFYYSPDADQDVSSPLDKYDLLPETYYFRRWMRTKEDVVYAYMNDTYQRSLGKTPVWS